MLVVRKPREKDPNSHLYDYDLKENQMMISDWTHKPIENYQPGTGLDPLKTDSILLNGRGTTPGYNGSAAIFCVECGKNYLFRICDGGSGNCQMRVSVRILNTCTWDDYLV